MLKSATRILQKSCCKFKAIELWRLVSTLWNIFKAETDRPVDLNCDYQQRAGGSIQLQVVVALHNFSYALDWRCIHACMQ